ncbi:DUF115 domain-containing protein, partial [Salmonella enterica]|nr:DUF115 domain-containing protein [Salmonella enterica]
QDKISSYYLKKEVDEQMNMVADASSIAVITLQMVCKMGFNPVILVGQNLAYLGDKSYADGSKRSGISTIIDKKALEESIQIENVYGEKVYTSKGFNSMREDMEKYISLYKTVRVINTTKGGARIAGAEFIELDQVISLYCKEKVVDQKWFPERYKAYNEEYLLKKINNMEKQAEDLVDILGKISEILNAIEKKPKSASKIQNLFEKFDKHTDRLRRNHFYNVFLMPMNRVQVHLFEHNLEVIRSEMNIFNKAAMLADSYRNCFDSCKEDFQVVYPLVLKMHQELKEKVKNGGNT